MKIAIIGYPRTGSTKLNVVLRNSFDINNYNELLESPIDIFSTIPNNLQKLQKLQNCDNFIVKFHSRHFFGINLNNVNWKMFDLVCATYRNNLVDAFISFYIAHNRNNWIKFPGDVWSTETFILEVIPSNIYKWYELNITKYELMATAIQLQVPVFKFEYNEIINNTLLIEKMQEYNIPIKELNMPFVPGGINYKEKCLNYAEVEQKFKELDLI